MAQARALDPGAGQQQHVERKIDAEPAFEVGPEHFEHAAGAGAEIEQRAERPFGERLADRALDRLVGDVQLADAVPFRGVGPEVVLRRRGARARAPPRAARGRARSSESLGSSRAISARASSAPPPRFGEPEKRPGAFAETLDQPGLDQELEVARDARLRLPQNLGEIGHRQFGLAEQREDAQARLLAGGLEGGVEGVEWQVGRISHGKYPIT